MCVWSAYAGKKQAAPLLWDSLTRIEGIWGGFYTGLVTLDEGSFHWEKCVGCTDEWKKQYELKDFPGGAGLIHSRTPDKALPAFRAAIRENPGLSLGKLCDRAIRPLFPHTSLEYCAVTAYRILETLFQAGEIRFEPALVPGWEDIPGRIFRIHPTE